MSYEWFSSASTAEIILTIVVSLLFTLLLYGTGPILMASRRKRPISKGKFTAFCIIYTFSAWFLFNLFDVLVLGGDVSSGGAAILWGSVFSSVAKNRLKKRGLYNTVYKAEVEDISDGIEPCATYHESSSFSYVTSDEKNTCDPVVDRSERRVYGPLDPPEKRKKKYVPLWAFICVTITCVFLCIGCIELYTENENIESEMQLISSQLEEKEKDYNDIARAYNDQKIINEDLIEKYNDYLYCKSFMSHFVGITVEYDNEEYFHTCLCEDFINNSGNFYIYPVTLLNEIYIPPRPSQNLCKPPMWCRIEAPHWRFYIWPERIAPQKKMPGGRKSGNCCKWRI